LRVRHEGTYEVTATLIGAGQKARFAPSPFRGQNLSLLQQQIEGPLLIALEQETDGEKRRLLKKAAVLIDQLTAELQAYHEAAEYDFTRPKDLQFRGWNMAKLQQALKRTEAS
jgi:hypothetical protein